MKAKPAYCHSHNDQRTYQLKRGGTVVLRNGCVARGNQILCGSADAVEWLRRNAVLSDDESHWLDVVVKAGHVQGGSRTISVNPAPRLREAV